MRRSHKGDAEYERLRAASAAPEKACPVCRELHDPDRGLHFDGKGVNSCGTYRVPLAKLTETCPPELGPVFAAAPKMLAALREMLEACPRPAPLAARRPRYLAAVDAARAAIARAEGRA